MPKTPADLRSLARSYTEMGVRVLAGIANSEEHPASARVAAVTALLDRGWGRPDQPVQVVDRRDTSIHQLSDAELHLIASRGLVESDTPKVLLIPPAKTKT